MLGGEIKERAYAAVTSLFQTLEYLVKFSGVVLEFKINHAKAFNKEVDQRIERWELDSEVYGRSMLPKEKEERGALLAIKILNLEIRRSFVGRTSDIEEFKKKTLEEINSSRKKVTEFLDRTRDMLTYRTWQCYELNRDLDEVQEHIKFFCEAATDTTSILWWELQQLAEDFNKEVDQRIERLQSDRGEYSRLMLPKEKEECSALLAIKKFKHEIRSSFVGRTSDIEEFKKKTLEEINSSGKKLNKFLDRTRDNTYSTWRHYELYRDLHEFEEHIKFFCEAPKETTNTLWRVLQQLAEGFNKEVNHRIVRLQSGREEYSRLMLPEGEEVSSALLAIKKLKVTISKPLIVGSFVGTKSDIKEFKKKTLKEINSSRKKLNELRDRRAIYRTSRWFELDWDLHKFEQHIKFFCEAAKETTNTLWRVIQQLAEDFNKEVDQFIVRLQSDREEYSPLMLPKEKEEYRALLAIDILKHRIWHRELTISEPLTVRSFVRRTSDIEEFKKKTLEEINSSRKKLNEFLDRKRDMLTYRTWRCYELNRDLDEFEERIKVFCETATETTLLCQELQLLATFLDSPSNINGHDRIVEHIRDVVDEAWNRVRDHIELVCAEFQLRPYDTDILPHFEAILDKFYLEHILERIFLEEGNRGYLLLTLKKVHSIREDIKALNLEDMQSGSTSLDASAHGNSNQEDFVVGLDDDICTIIEKLTSPPSLRREILTIVGMGGIGKTTLARKVFDHKSTVLHFHCRAWVTVSQVYAVKDLLFSLLCSVSKPTYEKHEKSKEDIGEELYRKLKRRRYLIVMDDLWNIKAWNAVEGYFPDDKKGSCIMLTSRSIINEFKSEQRPHHDVRLLHRDGSWELLKNVVFGTKSCPLELVDVGKQIASECQGLPLAIVVIAGLLSQISETLECWQDIADSVRSYVCGDAEKCMDILAFSYNKLPNRLKACWLYLGAFPEDCEIKVQKLVQLWIAEGFLDPNPIKELERAAEDNLRDLIGRNLILVGKRNFDGKVKTCRLHDFLRELCLREAEKEKFMYVLPSGAQGFRRGIGDVHRLSIHTDSISDVPLFPDVVSLMCFSLGYNFSPDILLFELQLKLLRVLDIYYLHFAEFPCQILEMVHLRYIALNVTYKLPESMSRLRNLQTIIIGGAWECPILSLEYWSMPFLRHLLTSVVCCLNYPTIGRKDLARPFAAEYLLSLSTISFSSCTREVFSIMPQLKKLCICETEKDYSMGVSSECLANLQLLCELETLKCSFYGKTGKTRDLSRFALPSNLKKLTLSWSYLPWGDMAMFAILGHLTVLKLKNFAFKGPRWEQKEVVFGCLKSLLIESTELVHWEVTSTDNFPALEHLVLKSCKSLKEIPCGVGELSNLSLIELRNCSKSAEESANEFAEDGQLRVVTRSEIR